jgi:aminoglycoside phosphotransferase (APT) family kinase protein
VPEWSADAVVDEALARRLIAQFPELTIESLQLFAEGWDNAVWLVNEQWAFRFPRRAIALPGVERELATLPLLAPLLPLPIPAPVFLGRPADGYPWPFFGSALLPGRETCDTALTDDARAEVAMQLGSFLRRLHAPELVHLVPRLPVDANRRGDMAERVPRTRAQLADLESLGIWRSPGSVRGLLDLAERLPPSEPVAVAHGDLHFRHILVDDRARVTGVIDWGDVCRADPAIDLQLVWSFLPPARRAAFLDAYGPVGDEQLLRARVVALSVTAALARYGQEEGMDAVAREALAGLERATVD